MLLSIFKTNLIKINSFITIIHVIPSHSINFTHFLLLNSTHFLLINSTLSDLFNYYSIIVIHSMAVLHFINSITFVLPPHFIDSIHYLHFTEY